MSEWVSCNDPHAEPFNNSSNCTCNNSYTNEDENARLFHCLSKMVILMVYLIPFMVYLYLFIRAFSFLTSVVTRRAIASSPNAFRIKLIYIFLLLFSSCGSFRILIAMNGHRYFQKELFSRIVLAISMSSWISSVWIISSLWISSFRYIAEKRVLWSHFESCLKCFLLLFVVLSWLITFTSQLIDLPVMLSDTINMLTLILPVGISILSFIFRYILWWPIVQRATSRAQQSKNISELAKKINKMGFVFLCSTVLFVASLLVLKFLLWETIPRFVSFALITLCIGVISLCESYFFDPRREIFPTIGSEIHHRGGSYGTNDLAWPTHTGEWSQVGSISGSESNIKMHSEHRFKKIPQPILRSISGAKHNSYTHTSGESIELDTSEFV